MSGAAMHNKEAYVGGLGGVTLISVMGGFISVVGVTHSVDTVNDKGARRQ